VVLPGSGARRVPPARAAVESLQSWDELGGWRDELGGVGLGEKDERDRVMHFVSFLSSGPS
jgi:hypothetical protein